jgi:transcription termination factor NusB
MATTRSRSRSAARLAAVQALYQQEMERTPVPTLLHEFTITGSAPPSKMSNMPMPKSISSTISSKAHRPAKPRSTR